MNVHNGRTSIIFFQADDTQEAVSKSFTRHGFQKTAVYTINPGLVPLHVEVSPNGSDWFIAQSTSDAKAIVAVEIPCLYMRVRRGAGAGDVTAYGLSQDPSVT
jgi:hypothetical protein